MTENVFTHPVRMADATVTVDDEGSLTLHVPASGEFRIVNLDAVIADLELARAHARRFRLHPDQYRPATPADGRQCCTGHAPVEGTPCCEDCPNDQPTKTPFGCDGDPCTLTHHHPGGTPDGDCCDRHSEGEAERCCKLCPDFWTQEELDAARERGREMADWCRANIDDFPRAANIPNRDCCGGHNPDGEAERCCENCPDALLTLVVDSTAARTAEIKAQARRDAETFNLDDMIDSVLPPRGRVRRLALTYARQAREGLPPACPACESSFPYIRAYVGGRPCDDPQGWHTVEPTEEQVRQAAADIRDAMNRKAAPVETIQPDQERL